MIATYFALELYDGKLHESDVKNKEKILQADDRRSSQGDAFQIKLEAINTLFPVLIVPVEWQCVAS